MFDVANKKRRRAILERLGIAWPHEVENYSIAGRTAVLRHLEEHAVLELKIKNTEPQYYSEDRHIMILKAIAEERKAIASIQKRLPIGRPMQLRLIKD
jgi:hypothetical protein